MLHKQHRFSFTVQSNICSIKQQRSKQLSDPTLTVWKLHHSMWPVEALIKAGGWEIVTCQTSLLSLRGILQDLDYHAKIPICKIHSSQSSQSCWHRPWGVGERMVVEEAPGTTRLNVSCSGVLEILLLRHGTAPAHRGSLGLAPSDFALQQPGAPERRVSAGASLAGPMPNLCQVVQISGHHASGVLQYQGDASPVSPQLMGSWLKINAYLA